MAEIEQASVAFAFTDEQHALRATVRRFADEQLGDRLDLDPATWRRLGDDLGVLGLATPEGDGGTGGTLVDAAVAMEELGAALAGGPLYGTAYLAIPLLTSAPASAARDSLLAPLCSGVVTAATAIDAPARVYAEQRGDQWIVSGDLGPVVDAGAASVLINAAETPDGLVVLAIELQQDGVRRDELVTLDLTRRQAGVWLEGAAASLVADPAASPALLAWTRDVACVLLAAEQLGAAQHLLDLTVEHAKTRVQFGRAIGSFQAVKHKLADLFVLVEHGRSAVYHAAWALDQGTDDPALAAAIAQAVCSPMLSRVAADTIQLHGGIGFTWEHRAHLYFKRAATDAALLGNAEEHRERLARSVLDRASATGAPPVANGSVA